MLVYLNCFFMCATGSVVPKSLIDAGTFRLDSIIANMMDIVVADIGIKCNGRILQGTR